ncbi:MAG: ABC transporter ATP-binding protein [Gemmatimonadaceae bacterium]|nr:ABC transporter ATP-binding protein [Gemmatimonadaceae bacterium]NUR19041.1 ABC transporter ATP-binding protein [Gemmatimonadaceae bacterium]NUS97151.1 ABC transporter ATP-binding protein [Gemmatimonadaceae bacterium]
MTLALRARSLMKRYRAGFASAQSSIDALRGLDLDVADGELLGLLGPNGAGKSTFLLCAAGLLVPDSGTLEWFGRPAWPGGRPAGIAYVPERSFYHRFLTVREALEFYATLHELPGRERAARVRAALERVGMIEHAEKRISQLSRGMLQRLGIAQAVIGRPRIILLDETLSGLDPLAARDARALLRALRDEGTTIILSSHDLLSLEHLASRIVVMRNGQAHATLDPASFTGARSLVLGVEAAPLAARLLGTRWPGTRLDGEELHVPLGDAPAEHVLGDCRDLGVVVRASRVRRDDLEQRFFDLIQPPARVAEPNP